MDFPNMQQAKGLWCWAAVSLSVEEYFNKGTLWTQCKIASEVKQKDCCADSEQCDYADQLELALTKVGRFRRMLARRLTVPELRNELSAKYPVCARIGWCNGGGHYVVVAGYDASKSADNPILEIADPWFGANPLSYTEFSFYYNHRGKWTHTYLVKE